MNKKRISVIIFILFASLFSFKVINPIIIEKNYKNDISKDNKTFKQWLSEMIENYIGGIK